jgi:hypothetical protein
MTLTWRYVRVKNFDKALEVSEGAKYRQVHTNNSGRWYAFFTIERE